MKDGYFTKREVTKQVKQVVSKKHGLQPSDILLNFVTTWRVITYPTGYKEKCATVVLRAEGFKPVRKTLSQEKMQKWHLC